MFRLFVERDSAFGTACQQLRDEVNGFLGVREVVALRCLTRYDVDGVSAEVMARARHTVFAEMGLDNVYDDEHPHTPSATLAYHSIEGKYDQREDFITQQLKMIDPKSSPRVRIAHYVLLFGDICDASEGYKKIRSYLINPIENTEASLARPNSLAVSYEEAKEIEVISGFRSFTDEAFMAMKEQYGIGMKRENLLFCQTYFKTEGRDPSITELKILDAYWSDHCRHSTFHTVIDDVQFSEDAYGQEIKKAFEAYLSARNDLYQNKDEKPVTLMDIAVMGMKKLRAEGKLDDLEVSEEVNACSIIVDVEIDGKTEEWLLLFKNETHNHPTEMEPYGGASTCIGGGIRDPLSGRSYVFGAMRVTGCGDPRKPFDATRKGKLPQRLLTRTAAAGYSDYANQIGLASGYLTEIYDGGYEAKRMECGALVAAVRRSDIVREEPQKGDVVILLGGNTGRDGCGGATGSSKEHSEDSLLQGGAEVQKGNPAIERGIVRLFRNPEVTRRIKRCNDFGAGGVSVAVGEIADSLLIDLNQVPTKYPGLDGTELAISESQERMAIVVAKEDVAAVMELAKAENTQAVVIAEVTDSNRMVMLWRGKEIVNLSREFLNSGGIMGQTSVVVDSPKEGACNLYAEGVCASNDFKENWYANLADLNVASKSPLASMFDATASNVNTFFPFGGRFLKTPEEGLAMRLPLQAGRTDFGVLMTVGYNPMLSRWSPYHGAMEAVISSVTRVVAMGGDYRKVRLSFQEYFERLGDDATRWGKPFAALLGALKAQLALDIPSIGGKDSMSGTFEQIDVPPALISFAVTPHDMTHTISRAFKGVGNKIIYIHAQKKDACGVAFDRYKENMSAIHEMAQAGQILSASSIGMGGIAAALSEMCFGNEIGINVQKHSVEDWFTPCSTGLILEIAPQTHVPFAEWVVLGETTQERVIRVDDCVIDLARALKTWEKPLAEIFQNECKPKVLIPVFSGAVGEYDLERKFKEAGATVTTHVFQQVTEQSGEASYEQLAESIEQSQILAIPSGVGIAPFIAIALRHPKVKQAVRRLVEERNGLILGLGEGFKALVDVGLLPFGEVQDEKAAGVSIIENKGGRYVSTLAYVKVERPCGPWFSSARAEDLERLPVSSGCGRIVLSDDLYTLLSTRGRIPCRFADNTGKVSMAREHNPFGSDFAVESMVSSNGRILGRMALSERIEDGLYQNVGECPYIDIFQNAVSYFL